MKTSEVNEIIKLIDELEILIHRTVHMKEDEYTFKNGNISNEEIDKVRNNLYEKLSKLDSYLFNKIDDGK